MEGFKMTVNTLLLDKVGVFLKTGVRRCMLS